MADGSTVEGPITKVVASGVSIVVGISDDRQITFQSGFEGDESDAAVNERFDRMMRFADRLKAKYGIPKLEEQLRTRRETLANMQADWARLEGEHARAQAYRKVQLDEIAVQRAEEIHQAQNTVNTQILGAQEQKEAMRSAGQDEWRKRGKLGGYRPEGITATNMARQDQAIANFGKLRDDEVARLEKDFERQIKALEGEIHKADQERDLTLQNNAINLERHQTGIDGDAEELAKLKALLEG